MAMLSDFRILDKDQNIFCGSRMLYNSSKEEFINFNLHYYISVRSHQSLKCKLISRESIKIKIEFNFLCECKN